MKTRTSLFVAFFILQNTLSTELPSFLHICRRTDPNLNKCIIQAVEEIRPKLITGIPDLNIPSLEPLVMQDLFSEDLAGMKVTTSNVSAFGCSDFIVKDLKVDINSHQYTFFIEIPRLRILADYHVDGKILVVPVKGNGNMEANVTDCTSTCVLQSEVFQKEDGQNYLRYTSIDLDVKVGGGHVRLENLFNGDKILLGVINEAINNSLESVLKEILPIIQKALSRIFLDISNEVVRNFTLDQLFPE